MIAVREQPVVRPSTSPAQRLRATMAAARVAFCWFGVRKTLTPEQEAQAADTFGAEGQYLSAGKKRLNTRHPAFLAVTNVRHQLVATWQSMSLPYPEPSVRLIRQDKIDEFNRRMTDLRQDLDEAVMQLDEHYVELKSAARERLGSLFNPSDYPESMRGLFGMTWDFPNIEPRPPKNGTGTERPVRSQSHFRRSANEWPRGSMKPCSWRSRPSSAR